MKKIFLALAATTISAVAINNTNAQAAMDNLAMNDVHVSAEPVSRTAGLASAVNLRALKDFKKSFANVSNESWSKIQDGFDAEFAQDGIKTNARYDKKGNWICTMRRYDESKLPRNVRTQVKSTYFDYSITVAQEIDFPDQTVYLVHLKDAHSCITVKVLDGEMNVYESFDKAN